MDCGPGQSCKSILITTRGSKLTARTHPKRVLRFGSNFLFSPNVAIPSFVAGDDVIPAAANVTLAQALSVSGNFVNNGILFVANGTKLSIAGNLTTAATLRFDEGSIISVQGALIIAPGASLQPFIAAKPLSTATSVTISIATFGTAQGSFAIVQTPIANFPGADCFTFGASSQGFTSTSLSVSIQVTQGGPSCVSGGLSQAALVAIIVCAVVLPLAIVAALLGAYFHKRKNANALRTVREKLNETELQTDYHKM